MTSSTGRPSTPPLAFTSSRHISSAVLITLLGAAPAPVNARLSPTLIGWPDCADALGKAIAPIAIAATADCIAREHQVHIAPSLVRAVGSRAAASVFLTHVVCWDLLFTRLRRRNGCASYPGFRSRSPPGRRKPETCWCPDRRRRRSRS